MRGRTTESALLHGVVDAVRRGESRTLLLLGEAGAGKSALLDYLMEAASDLDVARAVGVESEMELAFAGLHQLCGPMLDRVERLPSPQRTALKIVFGLSEGSAPDRFLVGLGVLSLFSEVAEERPLICVVDDAQWLDQASARTLAFVGRRLLAEPVGLVFGAREEGRELRGLPTLEVQGLRDEDARALLTSAVGFRLDRQVRDRIVSETRGNPLALLELPRGLTVAQLAGGFGLLEAQALMGRIEESFARRLDALTSDARLILLVAAVEPVGDPLLLQRAAAQLGVAVSAVGADTGGLLEIGERVTFRHPLVRSAVYRSAPIERRRAAHQALAEATDPRVDPDRRAWHLAAAAADPDERVAVELERSAGRAQARGGLAATAAFLERAVALTEDPSRRAQRALAAAQASLQAGAFEEALRLLVTAEGGPLDELQRALVDLLRAQLAFASSRGTEATPLLLAAAHRLEPLDTTLARETYLDAFSAALFGARLNEEAGAAEVAQAARATPRRSNGKPTAADLLLDALIALTEDYEAAVPLCRKALQQLCGETVSPQERLRWLWQGCVIALEVWDDESAYLLSQQAVQLARDTGTLSELALALSARTPILVFCREFSAAASSVAETNSVEEATGISSAPYGALILEAWRGRKSEAKALIEQTIRDASSRGEGIGVAISEYARAVMCNGLGEYEEALVAASSASRYKELVAENWGLSELIEPAVRAGRTDLVKDGVGRLSMKARAAGTDWARGIEARSRAMLSTGTEADGLYRETIDRLSRTRLQPELARAHLLYGEWLRREQRRVDARTQLRIAHARFASIGMEGFAERAGNELLATGERVRRRTVETRDDLTNQERHIARLAGDGLSNPEIGARLFLSPRTVEWHLRKVFTKLGISSRKELRGSESELIVA